MKTLVRIVSAIALAAAATSLSPALAHGTAARPPGKQAAKTATHPAQPPKTAGPASGATATIDWQTLASTPL